MNASGKWIIIGTVVLVVAGAGGVLINSKIKSQNLPAGRQDSKVETQNSKLETPIVVNPTPTPEAVLGNVVEATVEGSNYKFSPATITAKKGDTVRLTFSSSGGIHDLLIDEFGVQTSQLGEGEEEEVEFVADKIGTFEYYCSVGNHRKMGMTGKLVVE